jgi:hypothetical protein
MNGYGVTGLALWDWLQQGRIGGAIKYRGKKHPLFHGAGTWGYKFGELGVLNHDYFYISAIIKFI